MPAAVYLRLHDGRLVRFGCSRDRGEAAKLKSEVEKWIADGVVLSVGNARGALEEVRPTTVEAVELCFEQTPMRTVILRS